MGFKKQLHIGKIGESIIAEWLKHRGYNVLPVYEKEISEGKGPTLFTFDNKDIICPDIFVFNGETAFWVEAKHKSAFSWHRITKRWVTGIDLKHYYDYLEIANKYSSWPVFLLFLHRDGTAKDTPIGMISPTGLYGEDILILSGKENHRHENHGKTGMVYWAISSLNKYAHLEAMIIKKENHA